MVSQQVTRSGTTANAWYNYPHLNNYRQKYDFATYPVNGIDIPMPQGTPVTAVWDGIVSKRYYDAGGGQVIIRIENPGLSKGIEYYNFRHLDLIDSNIQEGTRVTSGQRIGQSGGQNSGGNHPAATNYSSGPHLGIGVSHGNYIPYTFETLTPELNPTFMIDYAKRAGSGTGVQTLGWDKNTCTCPQGYNKVQEPGMAYPLCKNSVFPFDVKYCQESGQGTALDKIGTFLDSLQALQEWLKDPVRIIKVAIGIVVIGAALFLLLNPQARITQGVGKVAVGTTRVTRYVGKAIKT